MSGGEAVVFESRLHGFYKVILRFLIAPQPGALLNSSITFSFGLSGHLVTIFLHQVDTRPHLVGLLGSRMD